MEATDRNPQTLAEPGLERGFNLVQLAPNGVSTVRTISPAGSRYVSIGRSGRPGTAPATRTWPATWSPGAPAGGPIEPAASASSHGKCAPSS